MTPHWQWLCEHHSCSLHKLLLQCVEIPPEGSQVHLARFLAVATTGALEHPRFIQLLVVALLILLLLNVHGASTTFRFHFRVWLMAILPFFMRIAVV